MSCAIIKDYYQLKLTPDGKTIDGKFNPIMFKQAYGFSGYSIDNIEPFVLDTHIPEKRLRAFDDGTEEPNEGELTYLCNAFGVLRGFFCRETERLENPQIWFVCGDGVIPCKSCGQISSHLCDYPIGDGKTCDIELCEDCKVTIGKFDFCPVHALQFKINA
jgi:hypothetical protein